MSSAERIGLTFVLLAAPLAAQTAQIGAPNALAQRTRPVEAPSRAVLHLAVDTPASEAITPVPIDGAGRTERGVVYDFFRIEQLTVRSAAAAGHPIDPGAPPAALLEGRLIAVAYRTPCAAGSATPVAVSLLGADGQAVPAAGPSMVGDLLSQALPGTTIPPESMGAAFGKQYLSGGDTIRITYDDVCQGPTLYTSPAIVMVVPSVTHQEGLSPGTPRPGVPAQIRVEAVVASDGKALYASMLAGPRELELTALETISRWTFEPGRANGVMVPFTFETTLTLR
jgi:hypothetical protein